MELASQWKRWPMKLICDVALVMSAVGNMKQMERIENEVLVVYEK
jgi:hypothetical protein